MKDLPRTKNALVVRTDFSDLAAWDSVCQAIQEPVGEYQFRAYVDFLNDPEYEDLTPERLLGSGPRRHGHSFVFLVDRITLTLPERPILFVDLREDDPDDDEDPEFRDVPVRPFRVIPSAMWRIENNLSLANMDFGDFARAVDEDGVFRGFRGG